MRMIDHKRHHVDTRSGQLSILAEFAALMNAFQMIVLYEIGMPDVATYEFSDVLLATWGVSCCIVACVNCGVMLIATLTNFAILDASANEGVEEDLDCADTEMFPEHPNGALVFPEQFTHLWHVRHDLIFRRIVNVFSYSVPAFMVNLGVMGFVRFYFYQQVHLRILSYHRPKANTTVILSNIFVLSLVPSLPNVPPTQE
jgi:hypothetical protein